MHRISFLILSLLPLVVYAQEQRTHRFNDFSGGMVTDYDQVDLPNNMGYWSSNFDIREGSLKMRGGYEVSTTSLVDRTMSVFKCTISTPNFYDAQQDSGLEVLDENGEIIVLHSRAADGDEKFSMRPKYVDTNPGYPYGDGAWTDVWSVDYNLAANAPGRSAILKSSGLMDWNFYGGVLRATAGTSYDGTNYTNPWWYGYIGRYMWQGGRHVIDTFRLYSSALASPQFATTFSSTDGEKPFVAVHTVGAITAPAGTDGVGLEQGRYWIKYGLEYDGYQYSLPDTAGWSAYLDVSAEDLLLVSALYVDTTNVSERITAIIVYTSNPLQADDPFYTGGGYEESQMGQRRTPGVSTWVGGVAPPLPTAGNITYFFRKKVVIADTDTSELGYWWKQNDVNGVRELWTQRVTANQEEYYEMTNVYIDKDDFTKSTPEMYAYMGHESNENIVLPRYSAMIGDQNWVGDVNIEDSTSTIHERFRNMVILSPYGQPDSHPINNLIQVGGKSGSYVTGMREWGGNALIWTNDAFEIWRPGNIPTPIEQFKWMGCTIPKSIQITPYGVFWGNQQGTLYYPGRGLPQLITEPIETAWDSLRTTTGTTSGLLTLPYAISAYLPDSKQYLFVVDTTNSSEAVFSRSDTMRQYGGNEVFCYDIPSGAWSRWTLEEPMQDFCIGWDGTLYGLDYNPNSADNTFDTLHVFQKEPTVAETCFTAIWNSGWTDFGAPGHEKEILGIRADYSLWVTTAGDTIQPDTLQVTAYSDGRESAYDTYKFYGSDRLATGGSNWRRVQYIPSGDMVETITDPSGKTGTLYRFEVEMGDALFVGETAEGELHSLEVDYIVREKRD